MDERQAAASVEAAETYTRQALAGTLRHCPPGWIAISTAFRLKPGVGWQITYRGANPEAVQAYEHLLGLIAAKKSFSRAEERFEEWWTSAQGKQVARAGLIAVRSNPAELRTMVQAAFYAGFCACIPEPAPPGGEGSP